MELELGQIKLGESPGEGSIIWSPFEVGHNKMAFLGDGAKHSRAFENIENQLKGIEGVPYFKINGNGKINLENEGTLTHIVEFEKEPESNIPNNILSKQRKDFVGMYINTILKKMGLDRKELRVSYRPTQEGPLFGYIKAAEHLEEELRSVFLDHIKHLDNVNWKFKDSLFSFDINEKEKDDSFLELLKGIWSFWVFAMYTPSDAPRVVHLDVPDISEYSEEQMVYMDRLIEILEELANFSSMVFILTTSRIRPLQRSAIRYKFLVEDSGLDYSFKGTDLEFDDSGDRFILIDDAYKGMITGVLSS